MKRRGFTLIELLMVIALIAALLMILVPAISASVRIAHKLRCKGNLKRIGEAYRQYMTDNEERLPVRAVDPTSGAQVGYPYEWDRGTLVALLQRYTPGPKVWYCPDNSEDMQPTRPEWPTPDSSDTTSVVWPGGAAATAEQMRFSYAILDGLPGATKTVGTNAVSDWDTPADASGAGSWSIAWWRPQPDDPTQGEAVPFRPSWSKDWQDSAKWRVQNAPMVGDLVLERPAPSTWIVNHGVSARERPAGMNVLYADGHVDWATPEGDDPDIDDDKVRWRTIWTKAGDDGDEKLHWVWGPRAVDLD